MSEPAGPPDFHRSTFCGGGGCVEVAAPSIDEFIVRDAKDLRPDAPVLRFNHAEWTAFLSGVAAGEFGPSALLGQH